MEELEEKVGGNYDEFIQDIVDIQKVLDCEYHNCETFLGQQIVEETLEALTNILKKYEIQKDIEIIGKLEK